MELLMPISTQHSIPWNSIPNPGTFPVVALMTGDAISRLTHDDPNCLNTTNYSLPDGGGDPCFHDACEQRKINIAVTLSLLVGILMVRWCD